MKSSDARRRLTRIAICLFAGLVVSVLVAWAIELVQGYRTGTAIRKTTPPVVPPPPAAQPPPPVVPPPAFIVKPRSRWVSDDPDSLVRKLRGEGEPVMGGFDVPPLRQTVAIRYGFPFECMQYVVRYDTSVRRESKMGVEYSYSLPCIVPAVWLACRFPLAPVFPGLAYNSLIFAAAWGIPGAIRAARRKRCLRGGRCEFCGYDLVGDYSRVCSECGRTREGRLVNEPGME